MNTAAPSPEVLARLLDEHADRFPEKAMIGPIGKQRVRLPILIANPKPGSAAFDEAMAVALNFRRNDDPTGQKLVRECLIWPRAEWLEWRAKWPAVEAKVGSAIAQKIGATLSVIHVPDEDAEPPEGIAPSAEGAWRTLRPAKGIEVHVAFDPPNEAAWRMFVAEATKPDAVVAERALEVVLGCLKASTMPSGELFSRWPGLIAACMQIITELAGNDAAVSLGNW